MSDGSAAAGQRMTDSFFRDRSFYGLGVSQFLGAFNDNLFKQLVLLLCVGKTLEQVPSQ